MVLSLFAISLPPPTSVGFAAHAAVGLRAAKRPCSPKTSLVAHATNGFTHGRVRNFSVKNILLRREADVNAISAFLISDEFDLTKFLIDALIQSYCRNRIPKEILSAHCMIPFPAVEAAPRGDENFIVSGMESPGGISVAWAKPLF